MSIAFIDDKKNHYSDSAEVTYFEDSTEFLIHLKKQKPDYDCIVTDRFANGYDCVTDGFTHACYDFGFKGPVLLRSASVMDDTQPPEGFFACSNHFSLNEIKQLTKQFRTRQNPGSDQVQ